MLLNTDTTDLIDEDLRIEDPIEPDDALDPVVVTTRRAISRVVHVAAETASRFEREDVPFDPVAWMVAPRRLFGGRAAIDACMRLEDFRRAILLHGLSLGLDADPDEIDALGDDDAGGPGVATDGVGFEGGISFRCFGQEWKAFPVSSPGAAVVAGEMNRGGEARVGAFMDG